MSGMKKKKKNLDKIKVLAYCDSPTCATGFGTVSRNIFEGLHKTGRYDIDILGINYWGDPHDFPYRVWPTGTNNEKDPYGRQKVVNMIPQMEYDLLFFLQDSFILNFLPVLIPHLKENGQKSFKSILYYPIDSILKPEWGENIKHADYLVAYSEFGRQESLKTIPEREDIRVIPHGVNTVDYRPVSSHDMAGFRQQYFGPHADKFIITNVNRNQQRKDIPRTIAAFKEFRKQVPNSILYLHMAIKDQGWNLEEVCKSMDLSIKDDVIFPQNFGPNQGYPREVLNLIYNASDVIMSTTLGEGFGLAWMEALAAKRPVIMPGNTMLPEFITEDIGWICKSGSDPSLWTVIQFDNEVQRPLTDVEDLVRCLLEVHANPDEAKKRAQSGYDWITTKMDWQKNIALEWIEIFDEAYQEMLLDQEKKDDDIEDIVDGIGPKTIESEVF